MNPFKGLKDAVQEIELEDGKRLKVKPKTKDAEMFILMKEEMTPESAANITNVLKSVVKRANEELDDEDVDAVVTKYYGSLLFEMSILFGFQSREKAVAMRDAELKKKLPKT